MYLLRNLPSCIASYVLSGRISTTYPGRPKEFRYWRILITPEPGQVAVATGKWAQITAPRLGYKAKQPGEEDNKSCGFTGTTTNWQKLELWTFSSFTSTKMGVNPRKTTQCLLVYLYFVNSRERTCHATSKRSNPTRNYSPLYHPNVRRMGGVPGCPKGHKYGRNINTA